MSREDELASAPMRSQGMFGPPPRTGPARIKPPTPVFIPSADPFESLTPLERQEWEFEWKLNAVENNVPEAEAKQDYLREIAKRRNGGINEDALM